MYLSTASLILRIAPCWVFASTGGSFGKLGEVARNVPAGVFVMCVENCSPSTGPVSAVFIGSSFVGTVVQHSPWDRSTSVILRRQSPDAEGAIFLDGGDLAVAHG